jgi:peptidyl-prolyl cis-trans isomerase C
VKSTTKLAAPVLFLIFSGICFPQTESKTKAAPAGAPAADSAPKAPAKETPKDADDEAIPQAAPNALFPALVARVNGKPVLGRDLEQLVRGELASIGNPEWKNLREDYRGQLTMDGLTSLINSKLLYQKAIASGVKATELEVQAEMQKISKSFQSDAEMNLALANQSMDRATLENNLRQTLAVSKYVEENVNKKVVVTPEEAAKYYAGHPTEFQHPDIVRSSHILIRPAGDTPEQDALAKQRAEALLARVNKGEDFAKLAKENSVDSSASQGGDIGFSTKANLAPDYGEAIFSMPVGSVKLVKTSYGYHIVKVTEKKKEGLSTLDEVKDQLTAFLKDQKAQEELTKLVNQLRDQAKVEILIPAGQPLKQ